MRKSPYVTGSNHEYAKHLRREGKRAVNKNERRNLKAIAKSQA